MVILVAKTLFVARTPFAASRHLGRGGTRLKKVVRQIGTPSLRVDSKSSPLSKGVPDSSTSESRASK